MNNNHLQETARHYAQLAEQARVDLQEANELNGELLRIIEALCEHFGLDTQLVLEDIQTDERAAESQKTIKALKKRASGRVSTAAERAVGHEEGRAAAERESPLVYGLGGEIVDSASDLALQHDAAKRLAAPRKKPVTGAKPASKHGPTDAEILRRYRKAAKHGPTI